MTRNFLAAASFAFVVAACASTAAPPDQTADQAPASPNKNAASEALGVGGAIVKSILSFFSVTVGVH